MSVDDVAGNIIQPLCRGATSPSRLYLGMAVQVEPMKPLLKAPGTKRLKLEYDELLSSFAFKFNVRRYTLESTTTYSVATRSTAGAPAAPAVAAAAGGGARTGLTFCKRKSVQEGWLRC